MSGSPGDDPHRSIAILASEDDVDMSDKDHIIELLTRIEANQRKALEVQQHHLEIAQAQYDRSNQTIEESITLQRAAVSRAAQITKVVLPLIVLLLALLAYVLIKWRIL